jgi:uncharacterized membrane protein
MKHRAQIVAALFFLLSFIKSFKYSSNGYDIVFILICACIYLVYEFLTDHKLKQQVDKLTVEMEDKFKANEKDMKDTKTYVSSISLGSTFKR